MPRREWLSRDLWTLGDSGVSVLLINDSKSTALVGTLITGDAVHVGVGCVWGGLQISVLSVQFRFEPKTALKNQVY